MLSELRLEVGWVGIWEKRVYVLLLFSLFLFFPPLNLCVLNQTKGIMVILLNFCTLMIELKGFHHKRNFDAGV